MSAREIEPDEHWVENACDGCSKPIPVAAGAYCVTCAFSDFWGESA